MDLVLNDLYRLICHKTKPNQTKDISFQEIIFLKANFFLERISVFNTRWQPLNLTKKDTDD